MDFMQAFHYLSYSSITHVGERKMFLESELFVSHPAENYVTSYQYFDCLLQQIQLSHLLNLDDNETQGAGTIVLLISCKNSLLPLRDEPLRLWPMLWVVVEEARWDLQRRSFREELAVHHTVLVDVSRKPL